MINLRNIPAPHEFFASLFAADRRFDTAPPPASPPPEKAILAVVIVAAGVLFLGSLK